MTNQVMVLVPSKGRRFFLATEEEQREFGGKNVPAQVVEYFQSLDGHDVQLLGIMGGTGQNLLARAMQFGIKVMRIPWYRLEELTGLAVKATAQERASAIRQSWEQHPEGFYQMEALENTIVLTRELTRVRLNIQDTFRKPANLQFQAAWRELEVLLPEGKALISLRTLFSNPQFIAGAKRDEKELEHRIRGLIKTIPIWRWLSPKNSVLPPIKGLGPSLGGSLVSEIGDIRRFPGRENLRAYARFHVNRKGEFPHREKGEISPWNRYLNRAVWLWSTDQMPRYDHPWRLLYDWKKARELQAHPEAVQREIIDGRGRKRTVHDFTLKHCDMRAKRWTGSQMLNYLWDLWTQVEQGEDPELWYTGSSWPAYFTRIEQELKDGLKEFLEQERKRRRREPKEEPEEVEEELV